MAGKQLSGDGLPSNLAGMSKSQLYDIMAQIKTLIEQNQQQARDILIHNPLLTRSLFQAQIMLGMVQTPQITNTQSTPPHPQQSVQPPKNQVISSLPAQIGLQEPANATQPPISVRSQQKAPPVLPISAAAVDPSNPQTHSSTSHPLTSLQQPKEHLSAQPTGISLPQSSQAPNIPPLPHHIVSQPSSGYQPQVLPPSIQMQTVQTSSYPQHTLQPPLPPQPRPPSMQAFPHQIHSQMGLNTGFHHSVAPQMHHSQPSFNSGAKPPPGMGPSFPQGQMPLPSQPLQAPYQGRVSHLGPEFNQIGGSVQGDRGSAWMPGVQDIVGGSQHSGPPSLVPPQMGAGGQASRPPSLTPEMEKALLQQVMSLTPEQINLLPPEQRNQVLQLQQMLRQ